MTPLLSTHLATRMPAAFNSSTPGEVDTAVTVGTTVIMTTPSIFRTLESTLVPLAICIAVLHSIPEELEVTAEKTKILNFCV